MARRGSMTLNTYVSVKILLAPTESEPHYHPPFFGITQWHMYPEKSISFIIVFALYITKSGNNSECYSTHPMLRYFFVSEEFRSTGVAQTTSPTLLVVVRVQKLSILACAHA